MLKIKRRAFFGVMWRGGYQAFHQIALFIIKLILVRLLLPADFGLIAMALIVFNSLDILNRFAGGEPFIRDNTSDPNKAKNTLFYLNAIFLGATALIGFLSAPHVAHFFSERIANTQSVITLIWIIRVFSLRLFFSALASVPVITLTKTLRFRELYLGNIAGTSAYVITAPILAFLGIGVWSIVIAHVVEQVVTTIIFFVYSPFYPSFIFDKHIAKKYLRYNTNIFVISIVMIVITEGDDTIIGRLMGPTILGYYNIGQQFSLLSTMIISTNICEIIFPIFSNLQNERKMFTKVFFKSFRIINLLAIPLIGGSVVLANEIVVCLFGERWLPMVNVFYILSISTLLTASFSIAGPALKSLDKAHLIRNCQLIGMVLFLLLIYPFATAWGYLGVCWLMVVLSIARIIYLMPEIQKVIDGYYAYIFKTLAIICMCSLIMMIGVYLLKTLFPLNITSLVIFAIAGSCIYSILMLFFDKELMKDIHDGFMILKQPHGFTSA